MRKNSLKKLLILFLFPSWVFAQSIHPSVFNMGGGASNALSVNGEWSIGEMAAIGTYLSSNVHFNAGVLQPKSDVVTGINEIGSIVFGNQITISPNPSYENVKVVFRMQKPGKARLTIFNSASQLYKQMEFGEIDLFQSKTVVIDELPVGVYFFKVNFQPTNGLVQNGIYKIIRL